MAYTPTLWAKGDKVTSEKLNKIEQGIVNKVDKENGKTLSTNDFTDAYKTKLDGIDANADKTTIDATLTNSGAAADAKATGDAIKDIENDLDGKIATIESNLDEEIENLRSLVGTPLKATTASDMTDTSKIYVYTGNESGYTNGDWYYHDGSAWVDGGTYNSVAVEVDKTLTVDGMPADAKVVGDEIGSIKEDLSDLKDATTTETSTQQVTESITPTWTSGYMTQNGSTYSNDGYVYSSPIPVSAGDVIQPKRGDGLNINSMRYVTCFNGNNAVTDIGGANVSTPYTVPDGCDSIVITISSDYVNPYANRTRTIQTQTYIPILKPDVDALLAISAPSKPGRIVYSFDVSANGTFTGTDDFQDQCGYRFCFDAKITSVTGEVKIGKGIGQTYGGGIGFDGTNLYQYFGTASDPVRTRAHGLTLKDYVSITLDIGYSKQAVVTISTNGGMYTWTIPVWRAYYGVLTVESVDALTGCILSYTSECAKKDIWVFGDSYISYNDTTRWMYYLVQTGHTDYLINGYPGRNSRQALAALKVALKMNHIPKTLIWLLGMNDKDTASAPNANWLSAIEEVMQICEDNHIELVFSTIPNVPSTTTKNDMKNAYVQTSGYRYIDFANAISADGSSTWYDGMLSSDNVHPDVQGAIALYSCAVTEVPELIL